MPSCHLVEVAAKKLANTLSISNLVCRSLVPSQIHTLARTESLVVSLKTYKFSSITERCCYDYNLQNRVDASRHYWYILVTLLPSVVI